MRLTDLAQLAERLSQAFDRYEQELNLIHPLRATLLRQAAGAYARHVLSALHQAASGICRPPFLPPGSEPVSRWVLSQDRNRAVCLQSGTVLAVVPSDRRFELRVGHLSQGIVAWTLGRFARESDAQRTLVAVIAGSSAVYWVEDLSPVVDVEWRVSP